MVASWDTNLGTKNGTLCILFPFLGWLVLLNLTGTEFSVNSANGLSTTSPIKDEWCVK